MTTPKELAEEFRRLAAKADQKRSRMDKGANWYAYNSRARAFEQAAQMVEERLK